MYKKTLNASEVKTGNHGFPYLGDVEDESHITYILTEKKTGYSVFFRPEYTRKFKEEIMSATLAVRNGEATLMAVWSGKYISKVFLIDDIDALETKVNKEIKETVHVNATNFSELKENVIREKEEERKRAAKYAEKKKKYETFLNSYTPNAGKYASISEIQEMSAFFMSDTTLRKILKEYNVPFRYEDKQRGKGCHTVMCFSLDDAIKALGKDHHKFDYLE